jgi:hypothetical protein
MNGEQGRESYDDYRSHDLPRIYEVSGIDTDEESSTSSFIEVDSNSNIIACILILLLVESSCDQSRCIIDLHCGSGTSSSNIGSIGSDSNSNTKVCLKSYKTALGIGIR